MNNKQFSKIEIRQYLIRHYGLDQLDKFGKGKEGILSYISKVSSLQQDPLNIIGINIDIILASRFKNYSSEVFRELLYKDKTLIEGWDKEASVFLSKDWRNFSFIRRKSELENINRIHYRKQDEVFNIIDEVNLFLKQSQKPISSKELNFGKTADSRWGTANLANVALSHLWSRGDAIIADRNERRKLYESSDNLNKDSDFESEEEFLEWYVYRRLSGLGVYWLKNGSGWQGHYLENREQVLLRLKEKKQVKEIFVEGIKKSLYITENNYEELLKSIKLGEVGNFVRFIAPLDNFIWDRKFIKEIFEFDYVWEVYKPVEKRKYGYYVLPILFGDTFIGRFEPEREKTNDKVLKIKNIWFESEKYNTPEINKYIKQEIERYNSLFSKNDKKDDDLLIS